MTDRDEVIANKEYNARVPKRTRVNPKQTKWSSLTNWKKTPPHLKKPPTPVK